MSKGLIQYISITSTEYPSSTNFSAQSNASLTNWPDTIIRISLPSLKTFPLPNSKVESGVYTFLTSLRFARI